MANRNIIGLGDQATEGSQTQKILMITVKCQSDGARAAMDHPGRGFAAATAAKQKGPRRTASADAGESHRAHTVLGMFGVCVGGMSRRG